MSRRGQGVVAALAVLALAASPAFAKKPAAADEAAVREIVRQIYADYNRVTEDSPEVATEGYEPTYSASLDALVQKWMPYASGDEVYPMADFDWYCQCQDFDTKTAHVVSQSYQAKGAGTIVAKVVFSGFEGNKGSPLIFTFIKEANGWALDDLKFDEGGTLRSGLQQDISDGEKFGSPQ